MPPKKTMTVPATVEDWEQAVHPDGTTIVDINASIHDQYKLQSGSAMEEEDFLHLKAVWQNAESTNKSQAHIHLRLGAWFNKASQDLDNYPDFNRYLSAVQRRDAPSSRIGMFWAAYEQQCQVAKSLHATSKVKKAYGMNEELVNMSLVNFIQAVCACHPGLDINCNPARVHLTFDFRRVKDEKQAKAIDSRVHSLSYETDGLLESTATGRMYAILEAKARPRKKHEPKVSWQETAQMVTAALNERGTPKHLHPGRVILFSQDGDELYVSEATIRAGYIKHMKDERKAPTRVDEFVKVQQFGPYWIQLREDMQYFAKLVLAVALRASQEEATSVSEHRLRPREAC
ncbi:hypothetical protein DTO006G1_1583 [Penicillium roqueforti]|nr:hypothetical protein CBS147337_6569 [Penicillium roqueforti]KAI2719437.1 hypothetical protein CBS147354_6034 [Penicillium roqueforti]KAI2763242.1 hypothetical protein DTO006G1_1583 [Penicillium roqueforti]KAI3128893.1 hypothetical protein CBS147330_5381 [Penicillium roqueforti]KAI3158511.1 hypothetical protein CBS147317_4599 [Penicillium roqueforti]